MIIRISSIVRGTLGAKKNLSAELHRYFRSKQFQELNATGNICLETSVAYKKPLSLDEYLKINPKNKIVTLIYTFNSYEEDDVTFFKFYLNEHSIDQDKFKGNLHLDINSIRFAYPVIVGSEIKMTHILADPTYFELESIRNKEGE